MVGLFALSLALSVRFAFKPPPAPYTLWIPIALKWTSRLWFTRLATIPATSTSLAFAV